SLGAYLSLSTGATDPGKIAAIVDYYGGLPPRLHSMASNLPPTLILPGDAGARTGSVDDRGEPPARGAHLPRREPRLQFPDSRLVQPHGCRRRLAAHPRLPRALPRR